MKLSATAKLAAARHIPSAAEMAVEGMTEDELLATVRRGSNPGWLLRAAANEMHIRYRDERRLLIIDRIMRSNGR